MNKHLEEKLSIKAPTLVRAKHSSHCNFVLFKEDQADTANPVTPITPSTTAKQMQQLSFSSFQRSSDVTQAVLLHPTALAKQEGLSRCLNPSAVFWGLRKKLSCLAACLAAGFRAEMGTFENTNCFLVAWEVCLEERQCLRF